MAVVAAAVSAMVIGYVWYGPLFGKMWMKLMGVKEMGDKNGMMKGMALDFLGALVMSYGFVFTLSFAIAAGFVAKGDFVSGAMGGFWVWLTFVATVMLGMVAWEKKPWNLYFINVGYRLVSMAVMAGIITAWM
jgi:uncharacterized membrane protein YagU involved in acid resistance